jgi:hypothetical protein
MDYLVQGEDVGGDGLTVVGELLNGELSTYPLYHFHVTLHVVIHTFYFLFNSNYLIKFQIIYHLLLCSVSRAQARR